MGHIYSNTIPKTMSTNIITDEQFEQYLRAKHAEVVALRRDGYGSVSVSIYGYDRSFAPTIKFSVDGGCSSSAFTGNSLTEAICKMREEGSPVKEAESLRRNAAVLLERAAMLEGREVVTP